MVFPVQRKIWSSGHTLRVLKLKCFHKMFYSIYLIENALYEQTAHDL